MRDALLTRPSFCRHTIRECIDMDSIPQKTCSRCKQSFPATPEFFYVAKNNKSCGLKAYCKECGKRDSSQYYHDNRDAITQKHHDNIEQERARRRATRNRNKDYYTQQTRDWRAKNPQAVKDYTERYYAENRQACIESSKRCYRAKRGERLQKAKMHLAKYRARARRLPHTFTVQQWRDALEYFNHSCAVCGRKFDALQEGQFEAADHWIPINHPACPGTTVGNIIPLCHGVDGCNNKKRAKHPDAWLIKQYGAEQGQIIIGRIQQYFNWLNRPY